MLVIGWRLELVGPCTTRMDDVPWRTLLTVSPFAGIVITEAVDLLIPKRGVHLDKKRLGQRNPDVVNDKKATAEIGCKSSPPGG